MKKKSFILMLLAFFVMSCNTTVVKKKPALSHDKPSPEYDAPTVNKILMLNYKKGRERTRIIEEKMVNNSWTAPDAEEEWKIGDSTLAVWEPIESDSAGWYSGRNLRRTYIYYQVDSPKDQRIILETMGNRMTYVNGNPRIGNRYQRSDTQDPWAPQYNYGKLPVKLKKGTNHLLFNVNRGRLKVLFHPLYNIAEFNVNDPTFPDILTGEPINHYGAVLVMNGTDHPLRNLKIQSAGKKLMKTAVVIPTIPPMTSRKVAFKIKGTALEKKGQIDATLTLLKADKSIDQKTVTFDVKNPNEAHKRTFVSHIDGSLQYYAVNPAQENDGAQKSLILSVHGAAVEAINQAGSYDGKNWAYIVAPTNRRPYGYDWEDWGRLDALEVLAEAKKNYNIDDEKVYLTGHSMGGHGTWYLGVTHPDQWAAIGPSAGWISFWTYVSHRMDSHDDELWKMMRRSSRPTDTYGLVDNIADKGIYIIHGADDKVVRADQAHQMIDTLKAHGINYKYHEEPGAGHWWDHSDEPGSDCVDWPPLFDYFSKRIIPADDIIRDLSFTTANPGVSAWRKWLGITAQEKQLEMSRSDFRWNPGSQRFVGTTENVARLSIKLDHLNLDSVGFVIDDHTISTIAMPAKEQVWFEKSGNQWKQIPQPSTALKGPHRYGTLKEAYKHQFVFVYGTQGDDEMDQLTYNKARFDAETFWYQGNGSIEIIADTTFDQETYNDRNVILFGNATNNSAYSTLLATAPVKLAKGGVTIGNQTKSGDDLACFFIYPKPKSDNNLIAVVGGTGKKGMKMTYRRGFMYPFTNAPDFLLYDSSLLQQDESGIIGAGFFGNDWSVNNGEFRWK